MKTLILLALLELSWEANLYPSHFDLPGITREGQYPLVDGHFGEIYKGSFNSKVVCIKYSKIYDTTNTALLHKVWDFFFWGYHLLTLVNQAFSREAILWSQLSHTNVLPFYGIHRFGDKRNRIGLVSPWMHNGNINQFLKKCPDADRRSLVSKSIELPD